MSDEIREEVRRKYAAIARGEDACCGPQESACGTASETSGDADTINMIGEAYEDVDGYEALADLQLGCGIPTEHAGLEEGQTVVDLGSGAGIDAFVARRIVGEKGRVVGLDFATEMVEKARSNAEDLGVENVSFVEGEIEAAGFEDVQVLARSRIEVPDPALPEDLSEEERGAFRKGGLFSLTIRGRRP